MKNVKNYDYWETTYKTNEEFGSGDIANGCGSCKKKKKKKISKKKMLIPSKWENLKEELIGFGGDESDYPDAK